MQGNKINNHMFTFHQRKEIREIHRKNLRKNIILQIHKKPKLLMSMLLVKRLFLSHFHLTLWKNKPRSQFQLLLLR